MRIIGITILTLGTTLLTGCGTESSTPATKAAVANANKKIGEAVDASAVAARAKRDEYVREMSKRMDDLNVLYEDLKARASKAEGQARKDLEKKLEVVKVKRDAAMKSLGELKDSSADRWEKIKDGVSNAYDELKKAFE